MVAAKSAKQLIAESYGRSARDFVIFADRLVYAYVARPLADRLKSIAGQILDVACGSGALGRLLPDVVESDISFEQLAQNPLPRKVAADAECLPFTDDAFAAAASAFGVNHFPEPVTAFREMARVAPVVGVMTWLRPDEPFQPKEIALETIAAHAGDVRSEADELVGDMTEAMGSTDAIEASMAAAGLHGEVSVEEAEVPWPGARAFVDYRLSMAGELRDSIDPDAVRADAIRRIEALPEERLRWTPRLVVGMGTRR